MAEGKLLWQEDLGIGVSGVAIYGTGDNARVVIGSDDGYVTIYSRTGEPLLQSRLDYDVKSVAVTPNGAAHRRGHVRWAGDLAGRRHRQAHMELQNR